MYLFQDFCHRYTCPVCLQFTVDAVETACCGKFLCQKCFHDIKKNRQICIFNCEGVFNAHISIAARRDIKNTRFSCIHQCGCKLSVFEKDNHEICCKKIRTILNTFDSTFQMVMDLGQLWLQLFCQLDAGKIYELDKVNKEEKTVVIMLEGLGYTILQYWSALEQKISEQIQKQQMATNTNSPADRKPETTETGGQKLLLKKVPTHILYILQNLSKSISPTKHIKYLLHLLKKCQKQKTPQKLYILNKIQSLINYLVFSNGTKQENILEIRKVMGLVLQIFNQFIRDNQDWKSTDPVLYASCLAMLAKLTGGCGGDEQEHIVIKLVGMQKQIHEQLYGTFEHICWQINWLHQLQLKLVDLSLKIQKQSLRIQIQIQQNIILTNIKSLYYSLQILQQQQYFYYLLGAMNNIFKSQVYGFHDVHSMQVYFIQKVGGPVGDGYQGVGATYQGGAAMETTNNKDTDNNENKQKQNNKKLQKYLKKCVSILTKPLQSKLCLVLHIYKCCHTFYKSEQLDPQQFLSELAQKLKYFKKMRDPTAIGQNCQNNYIYNYNNNNSYIDMFNCILLGIGLRNVHYRREIMCKFGIYRWIISQLPNTAITTTTAATAFIVSIAKLAYYSAWANGQIYEQQKTKYLDLMLKNMKTKQQKKIKKYLQQARQQIQNQNIFKYHKNAEQQNPDRTAFFSSAYLDNMMKEFENYCLEKIASKGDEKEKRRSKDMLLDQRKILKRGK